MNENIILKRKYVYVTLLFMTIGILFAGITSQAAAKKYVTRTDNLFVNDKGDFYKDTIKIGNNIYYTLDDKLYSYNVKTKKKKKVVTIEGGADILYYSNKSFYVANTYGNITEKVNEYYEKKYYDIYRIDIKNKTATKFLDDVDGFAGYCKGKYWYVFNGSLMSTDGDQNSAIDYNIKEVSDFTLDISNIYYSQEVKTLKSNVTELAPEEDMYDSTVYYYQLDASTGESKKISSNKYYKIKGMGTALTFPEKGVNNGRSSSIFKNISGNWNHFETQYFNDSGIRNVQTFKKNKNIKFYTGPKKKFSQAVCIFNKYIVVRIAGKNKSNYVLLNNKGKVIGKLGSENYKLKKYTRTTGVWKRVK